LWVPTSSRKSRAHTHSLSLSSSVFLLLPESAFSAAVLQGNPKDPTVLYRSPTRVPEGPNRPTRESEGPLLSTAAAPQVIQMNQALSAAALRGSLKDFVHPSTTALQRESEGPGMGISGFLQSPFVPFSSTKESLNLGTIWRKGHT